MLPRPCKRKQRPLDLQEKAYLDAEVQRMLKEGAIKESTRTDLVLSSIYTVPKKNGKRRAVINLRWVNSHLPDIHFKMSTMRDVKAAISPGCFMASLDLTDCFWGLPVAERDQRFLAFHWKGKNYTFNCLPFGLKLSPLFITKLYRHVVAQLQSEGHRVIIYLDDLLIIGDSPVACQRSVSRARELLEDLGAKINYSKSSLSPSRRIEYLGFEIDSATMTITAPRRKIVNLQKAMKAALRRPAISARDAASLLGKLQSMADAMLPVRVHTTDVHRLASSWTASNKPKLPDARPGIDASRSQRTREQISNGGSTTCQRSTAGQFSNPRRTFRRRPTPRTSDGAPGSRLRSAFTAGAASSRGRRLPSTSTTRNYWPSSTSS